MNSASLRFPGAMIASIALAFVLLLMPLSDSLLLWRPEWVALAFIYWCLTLPDKVSLFLAWFAGLFIDILFGSILGQHAFTMIIVVYMSLRLLPRISANTLWHQYALISLVLGTYLLINLWIMAATGNNPATWRYWLPLLSSLIIWPIYTWVLSWFRVERGRFDEF
ncbi:MAG: rod shape-determining protein MreD [Aquificaceae bacterium]|nr:MAG: rod shape-determining protein MreD [Aquificaceae bacterium]